MTKLLAMSGSARSASVNTKLATYAAGLAEQAGAEVTLVNLSDYPMPLYNGDLEEESGIPDGARALRELISEHDGLLLACPEYNGSITPLLKNTIDWTSRPDGETPGLVAYRSKVAGLLSASPGALGGLRGLVHVRAILGGIGMHVIPSQFALGGAFGAFGQDGDLESESKTKQLLAVIDQLVQTSRRLKAAH